MKQKDLLLIILVLLMVGVVKLLRRGEVIANPDIRPMQPFYEHFDSPNSFPYAPEEFFNIERVVIDNPAGSLTILPAENSAVTIQSTLVIFHPGEKTVEELRTAVHVDSKSSPAGVLQVTVEGARAEMEGRFQVNHIVWVPEGIVVDAAIRYGDIEAAHVAADLKLNHRSGGLRLSDQTGAVDIDATHSQIDLTNISGELRIRSQSSDLTVQNADSIDMSSRRCQVNLSSIRGQIMITRAMLNRIKIDKAARVQINGSGNGISLANISELVQIRDEFEDILMENISGDISVESKRSRIQLRHVQAGTLHIKNSFRDTQLLQTEFESGVFDLHQSDLELDLTGIGDNLVVDGVHSDIDLSLPAGLNFSADFLTRMGRIVHEPDSSFTENKARGSHSLIRQLPGVVKIRILTSYGDIVLKQAKKE